MTESSELKKNLGMKIGIDWKRFREDVNFDGINLAHQGC